MSSESDNWILDVIRAIAEETCNEFRPRTEIQKKFFSDEKEMKNVLGKFNTYHHSTFYDAILHNDVWCQIHERHKDDSMFSHDMRKPWNGIAFKQIDAHEVSDAIVHDAQSCDIDGKEWSNNVLHAMKTGDVISILSYFKFAPKSESDARKIGEIFSTRDNDMGGDIGDFLDLIADTTPEDEGIDVAIVKIVSVLKRVASKYYMDWLKNGTACTNRIDDVVWALLRLPIAQYEKYLKGIVFDKKAIDSFYDEMKDEMVVEKMKCFLSKFFIADMEKRDEKWFENNVAWLRMMAKAMRWNIIEEMRK